LMTSASLGFSLAGDIWALGLSRLFQGVGSSCSWAGGLAWVIASTPRERRGELLGTAMGAAVFGALLGPVLGALAGIVGIRAAFLGVTVAGVALAGWAAATPGVAPERPALRAGLIAPLVLASGIAYGAFYTPGLALVSHGAELAGVAQGLAFGLVNACWGIGALVGPAAGGALAGVAGDAVPYLVLAGVCVATYL